MKLFCGPFRNVVYNPKTLPCVSFYVNKMKLNLFLIVFKWHFLGCTCRKRTLSLVICYCNLGCDKVVG